MLKWPHLLEGLAFEYRRLRRLGAVHMTVKACLRLLSWALWLLLLPLTLSLHVLGHRRLMVFTDRIGHLALEPDCLLKDQALGHVARRRWFLVAVPGRIANEHLVHCWETYFPVHRGRARCFVLESMTRTGLLRHDLSAYVLATHGRAQDAFRVHSEWQGRPPLLTLTEDDRHWRMKQLQRIGLPEDAWFACVHVREPGFSPIDEELHAHRNGDIDATIPAIRSIVERGGWVIRIGDASMKPLPPLRNVIDYAHHPAKSDRLDVVLCASARFILGNTSGIALVGTVFGVPCAVANLIPTSTLWFGPRDIGIPKLIWSRTLGRHLRLDEILGGKAASYQYAKLYAEAGLDPIDNTPEDIDALAREMLDRLDDHFAPTEADIARARYVRSLFRPHHYAYHSCSSFAARFLRAHSRTLGLAPVHEGDPLA